MPSWKKVILSGSDAALNNLNVTNSVTASVISASQFTGSLFGTSSWANNVISSSFATTASFAINASIASIAINANNASIADTVDITSVSNDVSYYIPFVAGPGDGKQVFIDTEPSALTYNPGVNRLNVSGAISASAITSSLFGTASWAIRAVSSSYFS